MSSVGEAPYNFNKMKAFFEKGSNGNSKPENQTLPVKFPTTPETKSPVLKNNIKVEKPQALTRTSHDDLKFSAKREKHRTGSLEINPENKNELVNKIRSATAKSSNATSLKNSILPKSPIGSPNTLRKIKNFFVEGKLEISEPTLKPRQDPTSIPLSQSNGQIKVTTPEISKKPPPFVEEKGKPTVTISTVEHKLDEDIKNCENDIKALQTFIESMKKFKQDKPIAIAYTVANQMSKFRSELHEMGKNNYVAFHHAIVNSNRYESFSKSNHQMENDIKFLTQKIITFFGNIKCLNKALAVKDGITFSINNKLLNANEFTSAISIFCSNNERLKGHLESFKSTILRDKQALDETFKMLENYFILLHDLTLKYVETFKISSYSILYQNKPLSITNEELKKIDASKILGEIPGEMIRFSAVFKKLTEDSKVIAKWYQENHIPYVGSKASESFECLDKLTTTYRKKPGKCYAVGFGK